jgi:predicted nucleic acid-binding protein
LSTLLLDASVILAAFDKDDSHHGPAKAILTDPDITLATLDLVRCEVANVAVRAWGEPDRVSGLLEAVDRIADDGEAVVSGTRLLTKAAQLAQKHAISVYDAAYVAAAAAGGRTLVSCDERDLISKKLAVTPGEARERSASAGPSSSTRQ